MKVLITILIISCFVLPLSLNIIHLSSDLRTLYLFSYIILQQLLMSSNRREDELLNKLKSCLGSVNNENINIKDLRAIKNTYCNIKQGFQDLPIAPSKYIHRENIDVNPHLSDRNVTGQPLRPSNFNSSLQPREAVLKSYKCGSSIRNSVQLKHQAYNGKYDIPSSSEPTSKPGKRYEYGVKDVAHQYHHIYQEKIQFNRQLSHPHKELANQADFTVANMQYRKGRSIKQEKIHKNYRQEVEQRKQFLENQTTSIIKPPITTKNRQIDTTNANKQWPIPTIQKQSIKDEAKRAISKQNTLALRANSRSAKETAALAKLNRISELNQKINDRIRSIISAFQEHKT